MIIAFEGIDGAGKSTAVESLQYALYRNEIPYEVFGSSSLSEYDDELDEELEGCEYEDTLYKEIRELMDQFRLIGPRALCLLNASIFAHRWQSIAIPALNAGKVLIADRYINTPMVRDSVRGIELDYIERIYDFVPKPDITIYLDIDPEQAYKRKQMYGLHVGYYEAGMDINKSVQSTRLGFVSYQSKCRDEYKKWLPPNAYVIDSSVGANSLHEEIQTIVLKEIKKLKES